MKALGIITLSGLNMKEVVEKVDPVQPILKEEVKQDEPSKKVEKVTYYISLRK